MSPSQVDDPSRRGSVLLACRRDPYGDALAACLAACGVGVTAVFDGEEVVEQALAADHGMLLIELRLPGLDGAGVASLLRGAGYRGTLLALAPEEERVSETDLAALGFDGGWVLPAEPAAVRSALERLREPEEVLDAAEQAALDALVARLASKFLLGLPAMLAEIETALRDRQWPALRGASHRLKGAAGSLGQPGLSRLARPVEVLIDAGRFDEAQTCCEALLVAGWRVLASAEQGVR